MTAWGFHCSHELHSPSALLEQAAAAEAAGFDAISCSDHFHPWLPSQGHAGHSWSWLGAALERMHLPIGTIASPGQRQHPALVAQAIATLAQMHPGRTWLALGTGEALNESITGGPWPPKEERQARLRACVDVISRLLAGEEVTADEAGIRVRSARLYTLPREPVPLIGTALEPETAAWCASWSDGLITCRSSRARMEEVVAAYRRRGGRGPVMLQAQHGWARTDAEAARLACMQWPIAVLEPEELLELSTPGELESACARATPDAVAERIPISADLAEHRRWLEEYADIGFDAVFVFPLGAPPLELIDAYRREVLPRVQ